MRAANGRWTATPSSAPLFGKKSHDVPIGERPLDGYTIQRGIGRGGFGEVYHAVSDGGKQVALKLVQRNMEVELRGVGQCLNLKHQNLIALHDVRQATNGDCWVVMELMTGETLDQAIARHPQGMPPEDALAWLRGLCDGVGYLHEQGIVHRDLKPGNIFREEGLVKIGDYGLSKFISASRRSGQTGSIGTVHYMAPEVAGGRYGKELDLYALGVILYEMLTGRVPFDGDSPSEILMKHLTATPDLAPVPAAFRPVVARLLNKDPYQRYSSVQALLADLSGYLAAPPAPEAWPSAAASAPPSGLGIAAVGSVRGRGQSSASPLAASRPASGGFVWSLVIGGFFTAGLTILISRAMGSAVHGIGVGLIIGGGFLVLALFVRWIARHSLPPDSGSQHQSAPRPASPVPMPPPPVPNAALPQAFPAFHNPASPSPKLAPKNEPGQVEGIPANPSQSRRSAWHFLLGVPFAMVTTVAVYFALVDIGWSSPLSVCCSLLVFLGFT